MGIQTEQAGYCSKQTSPKLTARASAQEQMFHVEKYILKWDKVLGKHQPRAVNHCWGRWQPASLGHWGGEEEQSWHPAPHTPRQPWGNQPLKALKLKTMKKEAFSLQRRTAQGSQRGKASNSAALNLQQRQQVPQKASSSSKGSPGCCKNEPFYLQERDIIINWLTHCFSLMAGHWKTEIL